MSELSQQPNTKYVLYDIYTWLKDPARSIRVSK
jgi:hypothetical protein